MPKIDLAALPPEVRAAYEEAVEWLAVKFSGRRTQPVPAIVKMAIPEEGEEALIYGVLVPTNGEGRKNINRLALAVPAARAAGGDELAAALARFKDRGLVECLFWAGIPAQEEQRSEDGKTVLRAGRPALACAAEGKGPAADPRVRARDFLRSLQDEPGSLAAVFDEFGNQVSAFLAAPDASLGKP